MPNESGDCAFTPSNTGEYLSGEAKDWASVVSSERPRFPRAASPQSEVCSPAGCSLTKQRIMESGLTRSLLVTRIKFVLSEYSREHF